MPFFSPKEREAYTVTVVLKKLVVQDIQRHEPGATFFLAYKRGVKTMNSGKTRLKAPMDSNVVYWKESANFSIAFVKKSGGGLEAKVLKVDVMKDLHGKQSKVTECSVNLAEFVGKPTKEYAFNVKYSGVASGGALHLGISSAHTSASEIEGSDTDSLSGDYSTPARGLSVQSEQSPAPLRPQRTPGGPAANGSESATAATLTPAKPKPATQTDPQPAITTPVGRSSRPSADATPPQLQHTPAPAPKPAREEPKDDGPPQYDVGILVKKLVGPGVQANLDLGFAVGCKHATDTWSTRRVWAEGSPPVVTFNHESSVKILTSEKSAKYKFTVSRQDDVKCTFVVEMMKMLHPGETKEYALPVALPCGAAKLHVLVQCNVPPGSQTIRRTASRRRQTREAEGEEEEAGLSQTVDLGSSSGDYGVYGGDANALVARIQSLEEDLHSARQDKLGREAELHLATKSMKELQSENAALLAQLDSVREELENTQHQLNNRDKEIEIVKQALAEKERQFQVSQHALAEVYKQHGGDGIGGSPVADGVNHRQVSKRVADWDYDPQGTVERAMSPGNRGGTAQNDEDDTSQRWRHVADGADAVLQEPTGEWTSSSGDDSEKERLQQQRAKQRKKWEEQRQARKTQMKEGGERDSRDASIRARYEHFKKNRDW